ncbi:MAG TPA: alpha/beta hydrolase [Clostridia bacterium]|nr:alpha/beta hydrolase [Clostridia bacterium]
MTGRASSAPARNRAGRVYIPLLAIPTVLVVLILGTSQYLRATFLLLHIQNSGMTSGVTSIGMYEVDETTTTLDVSGRSVRARFYIPRGLPNPSGLVLLHGVHHLGIDEPRLVSLARTLAEEGTLVYTPELPAIADYTVDATSQPIINAAVSTLSAQLGAERVGLMGLSFAGGLALIAAADPTCAPHVAYVVAIGAHHNLERVLRFFATDHVQGPDGVDHSLPAHEYGPLVVVYSHTENFFSRKDAPVARQALRLLLHGRTDESRAAASRLTPTGRARMADLYAKHRDAFSAEMLRALPEHRQEMQAASPAGRLSAITVPVLLLHGAGDTVIPATETEWIAREVPGERLRAVLVSPAISHVDLGKGPGFRDKLALVRWVSALLEVAEDAPNATRHIQVPTPSAIVHEQTAIRSTIDYGAPRRNQAGATTHTRSSRPHAPRSLLPHHGRAVLDAERAGDPAATLPEA